MKFLVTIILVFSVLTGSCTIPVQQTDNFIDPGYIGETMLVPDVKINRLMVSPAYFKEGIVDDTDESYRKKKSDLLTSIVYDEIAINKIYTDLVPYFKTMEVVNELIKPADTNLNLEHAKEAAIKLNADKMFVTRISRYEERKGSELGVEQPASVSFTTELYDVESGNLLWRYIYSETQEPLLEDVSKFKKFLERGGKWVTADQLAEEGIKASIRKLRSALQNQN